ncbi:MAG: hypothetical protein IIB61_05975, partial [Planctomycetes bacterium]|nr:hypothetical protein [Planctomycetota bacterium]
MNGQKIKHARPIRWIALVPWLFVAMLAHVGVMLVLYVWRPEIGPPDDPIAIVSLTPLDNPYTEPVGLPEPPPGQETVEPSVTKPA